MSEEGKSKAMCGPIYGTHELAEALRISPNTLKTWRWRDKLPKPTVKLGGREWVWQGAEIEEFIEQHRAKKGKVMGQTLAELNAAAGKPKAKAERPRPREQIEVTVTFLLPVEGDEDSTAGPNGLVSKLQSVGMQLTGPSTSYEVRRPCWFLVSTTERIGRRLGTRFTYRRPGSPR